MDLTSQELRAILFSHAWFDLAPWDANPGPPAPISARAARGFMGLAGPCAVEMRIEDNRPVWELRAGEGDLTETVRKCLSLDIDVSPLHELASRVPGYSWIADMKLGRYLRSPTLFEDAFKIMCTTGINWEQTKKMVRLTVENWGTGIGTWRTFPAPSALRGVTERELKDKTRCGRRAKGLLALIARAEEKPDIWQGDGWKGMGAEEFEEEILSVRGLGPMCTSYLGRFYGKPNSFTIDSWVEGRCKELWRVEGKEPIEEFARKRYKDFGKWAPNVFWFEITRYWHERDPGDGEWKWWEVV